MKKCLILLILIFVFINCEDKKLIRTEGNNMLFFVKVRIDLNKMVKMGQKLQSGELDTSAIKLTYCIKDDPSVGLNIWEANDREDFDKKFKPHKEYYAEVMEITPVITPDESYQILLKQLKNK
jgi:hypothetical protein